MITGGTLPTLLHPIDQQKVLAGGGGVCSSGYLAILCSKCKELMPNFGQQIHSEHVCQYCYTEYQITKNTMDCPYRQPRSRRLPAKVTSSFTLNNASVGIK